MAIVWTFCTQVWTIYRNSEALKRSTVVAPTLPSEFKNSIIYSVVCFLSANSWVILFIMDNVISHMGQTSQ